MKEENLYRKVGKVYMDRMGKRRKKKFMNMIQRYDEMNNIFCKRRNREEDVRKIMRELCRNYKFTYGELIEILCRR